MVFAKSCGVTLCSAVKPATAITSNPKADPTVTYVYGGDILGNLWRFDLRSRGATPVPVSLPGTRYAVATYYIIAPAEASSNLARYDGVRFGLRDREAKSLLEMYKQTRSAGFGAEVKRRVMLGTFALSAGYYDAYYGRAQKVRTVIKREMDEAFAKAACLWRGPER